MAFNGNNSAVLGNDAVEVEDQVTRLAAANPFALLRGDSDGDGEEVANLVSRFTAEENGKNPVNGNKSQRYSDHEKGEKQQARISTAAELIGHTNSSNKHEEAVLINGKSRTSNGDASNKPEEDESSNGDGWQVIKRRQHEIGSGIIRASRPARMHFGGIPSNLSLTPSSDQLKPRIKLVKNNAFFKRDNNANRTSDVHVKPAAKDQQRRRQPPANISTGIEVEAENRMRTSNNNKTSNQIVVNNKAEKPSQKVQKDNHVPKGGDVAREATKEAEFKKVMTIEAYEKLLEEKRKALECLKPHELVRVVTLDKDFESMRVIEKKKEEPIFIKLNSESDKAKKKKVTMDKNGSKALVTNFKLAGTKSYRGRPSGKRREESGGDIKSVKSYEELFPAFPVNGSTK